jgi:hypothetical protein
MTTRTSRRWHAAIVAAGLIAATGCGIPFSFSAEAKDQWKKSYTLAPGGSFEIHNTTGRIEIRAGDGDTVDVVADRVVRAGSDEDARNALKRFEFTEKVTPDQILIDTTSQGLGLEMNVSKHADFVVHLPRSAAVKLVGTNADIDVADVGGVLTVETTNGKVNATSLGNAATVETTNGAVYLDFANVGAGGISCVTTNGRIEIVIPRASKASLSARVTNGAISTQNLDIAATEQSKRRLDASIGGGGPAIRLETTNGLIELKGR